MFIIINTVILSKDPNRINSKFYSLLSLNSLVKSKAKILTYNISETPTQLLSPVFSDVF